MKTHLIKNKNLTTYVAMTCLGTLMSTQAATTIINGFSAEGTGGLNSNNITGNWEGRHEPWAISSSVLTHQGTGTTYNTLDEGILGLMVVPIVSGSTLDVSFDYNVGANTTIYLHLRGYNDTGGVDATDWYINEGAQNGNAWDVANNGDAYNLFTGAAIVNGAASEAVSFAAGTNGNYTQSIDMSGYTVSNLSDYEYILVGFAADTSAENASTISNLSVTVPEPSSTMLFGLGGLALIMRRRR